MLNLNASDASYVPVTTSRQAIYATIGTISSAPPRQVAMSGSLLELLVQSKLRREPPAMAELAGGLPVLNLTLNPPLAFSNDTLLAYDNFTEKMLTDGVLALSSEPNGWNQHIRPNIRVQTISASAVSFIVPPSLSYAITAPETVLVHLPKSLLAYEGAGSLASIAPASDHIVAEPLVVAPPRPTLRLREDGDLFFFFDKAGWFPERELTVPVTGAVTAKELREARQPKNMTLVLRTPSGELSDTWLPSLTGEMVVGAMQSAQSEPNGWNAIIRFGAPPSLTISNETLVIQWPTNQFASYAPRSPELIHVSLPPEAVRSGVPLFVGSFVISVDAGSVALSDGPGSRLLVQAYESDLRSSASHSLDVTLSGDTWLPSVGLDGGASALLLQGVSSAQSEPGGWNQAVQPLLTSADVVRLDAQTVRLTIPQRANYDVVMPETLSFSLAPGATFGTLSPGAGFVPPTLAAPQTLVVQPSSGLGRFGGDLMTLGNDASIQAAAALTLRLTLIGDLWKAGLETNAVAKAALLNGLRSAQGEARGWNAIVLPKLLSSPELVQLVSDTAIEITIPSLLNYDISAAETISAVVPPEAVASGQVAFFALPFLIYPAAPKAVVALKDDGSSGNIISLGLGSDLSRMALNEVAIQAAADVHLMVTLSGTTLSDDLGVTTSAAGVTTTLAVLAGLQPTGAIETLGWRSMVSPLFGIGDITVLSPTRFDIRVPQAGSYRLAAPESIELTIPSVAVQYAVAPVLATPPLVVSPSGAYAELGGTLLQPGMNSVAALRTSSLTITITLSGADWGLSQANAIPTTDLLAGIRSAQDEPANNAIAPLLSARYVTRSATCAPSSSRCRPCQLRRLEAETLRSRFRASTQRMRELGRCCTTIRSSRAPC